MKTDGGDSPGNESHGASNGGGKSYLNGGAGGVPGQPNPNEVKKPGCKGGFGGGGSAGLTQHVEKHPTCPARSASQSNAAPVSIPGRRERIKKYAPHIHTCHPREFVDGASRRKNSCSALRTNNNL